MHSYGLRVSTYFLPTVWDREYVEVLGTTASHTPGAQDPMHILVRALTAHWGATWQWQWVSVPSGGKDSSLVKTGLQRPAAR